ncbi:SDR family NAD(P)-dependent oxidoreductase [Pseudonocardia sp. WMMC193]|uniref:SDR family NAD(P)-dependent oxidoreductase n=1 Tax=Pseudonocardia sp. WMMC193 TaxID=2911965 RepID=UPI001F3B07F3|nr:SDR family oxidoreductase [Pseudonocardia sp. WMMC193]MCF7550780.1 SDR family oxidoreductase [Pseudonocardia sp. WMMC193]
MGELDGKVALVTGSGRGIGRAVAQRFAAEGAGVVANDLDGDLAKEAVAAIEAAGGTAVACADSVTEDGLAERFVQIGVDELGGPDIIVDNAGYTWDSVVQRMSDDQWDAISDVHLKAPFRILRATRPVISAAVKKAGEAVPCRKVVKISSIAGTGGKIDSQGRQIAVGVNPDLLRQTEATILLGRGGSTEEAPGSVLLLCIPESDYVSGQLLSCGGGFE